MKIMIDAGHGGADPGAIDKKDKDGDDEIYSDFIYTEESYIALEVALLAENYLSKLGHEVYLTRDTEEFITLKKRTELANSIPVDIFISIHANAFPDSNVEGVEVFHYPGSPEGKKLASLLQEEMVNNTYSVDRGIKESDSLYVLKKTDMPAVLIEVGFITNPREEILLNTDIYKQMIVKSIIEGVESYEKQN